jgi:large subunit ribosomal protein L21
MYAIVEISGKQFRVENNMKLRVPLQNSKPGEKIGFDRVLLIEDDKGNTTIGNPLIKDTQVAATVVEHGRDKKVIVFKKKRRKGYQKKNGHRQGFSLVEINSIGAPTIKKEKAAAKTTLPKADQMNKVQAVENEVKVATVTKKEVKSTKETSAKKTTRTTAKKSTVSKTAKTEVKAAKATPKVASKNSEVKKATKKPAEKKETKED